MARKKSTATVAMGLVDIDGPVAAAPPLGETTAPAKRGRKPGVRKAKAESTVKGRRIVVDLDAATRGSLGSIANRLDRSITWVATRLLTSTVTRLATAGDDFLAEAEALKLR